MFFQKEFFSSKPSNIKLKAYVKSCLADQTIDKRPYPVEENRYAPIDPELVQTYRSPKELKKLQKEFADIVRAELLAGIQNPDEQAIRAVVFTPLVAQPVVYKDKQPPAAQPRPNM